MKRVLVTGSGGQLGKSIEKISADPKYDLLEITFKSSDELNIKNPDDLNDEFSQGNFDFCINCAAFTDVEMAEKEPAEAYAVNRDGARNVALTCQKFSTVLIHISTDYVFDGDKNTGYTTADLPNPINEYGRSKWEGEQQIQTILTNYFIVRTSWLYSEFGRNFYTTIVSKAKQGEELFVTKSQIGCPTHASNLASYILHLISENADSFGIHHFTDGEAMSWFDFAKSILKKEGLLVKGILSEGNNYRTLAQRPQNSVLVNSN